MARTIKFTKKLILEKTKYFIEEKGIDNLNARDLCEYIGCSTQPLFKNFDNMNIFKKELKNYLHDYCDEFIKKIVDKNNYLFSISYAYALFAFHEYNIFKALFMSDLAGNRTIDEVLCSPQNIDTINSIPKQYHLSVHQSEKLYIDVRFYTHGLSCQLACRSILLDEKEIKKLISNIINNLKEVI